MKQRITIIYWMILCTGLSWGQSVIGVPTAVALTNASFELPDIPSGSTQQFQTISGWTFFDNCWLRDIVPNNNACNQPTVSGQQVLVIGHNGQAQQTVTLQQAGCYRLSLVVARDGCNSISGFTTHLKLNGILVGRIVTNVINHSSVVSAVVKLPAGQTTIDLLGVSATASLQDKIVIDNIQLEKVPVWSEVSTWAGGTIPVNTGMVYIPPGKLVAMDNINCYSGCVMVDGLLTAPINTDFHLYSKNIHAMNSGLIEIGREGIPFNATGTITLVGDNGDMSCMSSDTMMGTKVLGAMENGRIELHAVNKLSWTQLENTAQVGQSVIRLKEQARLWQVNDKIVLASSDFDMNHAEVRTIVAISADKQQITLDQPLNYRHFGELQQYSGGNNQNLQYWTLDERTEVGMLTHNLVIEGDPSSASNGFGGHLMMMDFAVAHIENIEFRRMGQAGILGRYPFHWHKVGEATGQYFVNNSVHDTYNRAITIHGTNGTNVRNNVCYNNPGHAIFMEDGNEINNRIIGNLVLVTTAPPVDKRLLPSDAMISRNASGPSSFWITNPNNIVQNNRSAGSAGSGFWFAFHRKPDASNSNPGPAPNTMPLPAGYFDGNTAHSNVHGWLIGMAPEDSTQTPNLNRDYAPSAVPVIKNLTVYKNVLGVYSRIGNDSTRSEYENMMVADNWEGEASTWITDYRRILWVGASANYEPIPGTISVSSNTTGYVIGHILYDGPVRIYDSHFTGFNGQKFSVFDQWGANIKYTGHSMHNTTIADPVIHAQFRGEKWLPVWFNGVIYDVTGHFVKGPMMTAIMQDHPVLVDNTNLPLGPAGNNSTKNQRRYCYVEVSHAHEYDVLPPGQESRPTSQLIREDGAGFTETVKEVQGVSLTLMVNNVHQYKYVNHKYLRGWTYFKFHSMNAGEFIILELPGYPQSAAAFSGYGSNSQLPSLADINSLLSYNGSACAYINGSLFIRFQAPSGSDFRNAGTSGVITTCWSGGCVDQDYVFPDNDGDGLTNIQEQFTNSVIRYSDNDVTDLTYDFTNTDKRGWNYSGSYSLDYLNGEDWYIKAVDATPYIIRDGFNINGNMVDYIDMRVWCESAGRFRLSWKLNGSQSFMDIDTTSVPYTTAGEWKVIRFKLDDIPRWQGQTITELRIEAPGTLPIHNFQAKHTRIDWIKARNEWVYDVNYSKNGGNVSVKKYDGGGNYFTKATQTFPTALNVVNDERWSFDLADWNNDGYTDLVGFKKNNTGTPNVELHILDGKSDFTSFLVHVALPIPLSQIYENDPFLLGDYNGDGKTDIWYIKRGSAVTGNTTVRIIDGNTPWSSAYLLNKTTGLGWVGVADDFAVQDYNGDGKNELWYIKKQQTDSQKLEVHVLGNTGNNATAFNSFVLQVATIHPFVSSAVTCEIGDFDRDGIPDLVGVNRTGAGSKTSFFVLNGSGNFQTYLLTERASDQPAVDLNATIDICLFDNGLRSTSLGYRAADIVTDEVITEKEQMESMFIYPNPANESVFVVLKNSSAEIARIELYGSDGSLRELPESQIIYEGAGRKLQCHGLIPGLYFVKCTLTDGRVLTEKAIIQ